MTESFMNELLVADSQLGAAAAAAAPGLPDTADGCRQRLATLQSDITAIRLQVASADMRRQASKQPLDADWFHRAKTAQRLKQEEWARVSAQLHQLTQGQSHPRERFKDALIAAVRAECDDARWTALLQRARLLHDQDSLQKEMSHG